MKELRVKVDPEPAIVTSKRQTGREFEAVAADYLEKKGMTILEHSYTTGSGEIDLIALEGDTLVFCEVKFRRSMDVGAALEAVHPGKQMKIIRTARYYLMRHRQYQNMNFRFDVIGISGKGEVCHIEGAFDAGV